jgi:hypothetical protein
LERKFKAGLKASAPLKNENREELLCVSAGVRRHLWTTGGQPIQPTIPLNRRRYGCLLTRMENRLQIPMRSRRFVLAREPRVLGAELHHAQKCLPVLAVLQEIPERSASPGHASKLDPEPRRHCPQLSLVVFHWCA